MAEMKLWSRVDLNDEDALITGLITAARMHLEKSYGVAIPLQTWEATFDGPESRIYIPKPPTASILSVKDENGTNIPFTADTDAYPAVLNLSALGKVTIQFRAGYSAVPENIRQAIYLLASHYYHHREAVVLGKSKTELGGELPLGVASLMANYNAELV